MVESPVTELKEINGQAVLPLLETPGTKVQIMMTMHVGDSCLQVWELTGRLIRQNKCHFHHQSHPHSQLLKETNFKSLYPNMH